MLGPLPTQDGCTAAGGPIACHFGLDVVEVASRIPLTRIHPKAVGGTAVVEARAVFDVIASTEVLAPVSALTNRVDGLCHFISSQPADGIADDGAFEVYFGWGAGELVTVRVDATIIIIQYRLTVICDSGTSRMGGPGSAASRQGFSCLVSIAQCQRA